MTQYIHKPTVVTALQFNGANHELIREFCGKKLIAYKRSDGKLYVNTFQGMVLINKDDYIVRGIRGEVYPVCCEVFEEAYTEIKDSGTVCDS